MSIRWTPERTAKFKATMKAKRAKGWKPAKPKKATAAKKPKQMPRVWQQEKSNGHAVHDAIGWLRYAEESAYKRLREGKLKKFDEAHLFAMQALRTLEGGGR